MSTHLIYYLFNVTNQTLNFFQTIIIYRACPECRTCSDFVVPSKYWVEEKDDKEKLIHDYKANLK